MKMGFLLKNNARKGLGGKGGRKRERNRFRGRRIEDVAGNVAEGPGVRTGDGRYRWNS